LSLGEDGVGEKGFGGEHLSTPDLFPGRPGGELWGSISLGLDLAGGPYRLMGLSEGQERALRERFGERVDLGDPDSRPQAEGTGSAEVPVRVFRAARSDFRSFDRTGREMTLDRRYEERAVSLAGWKLMGRLEERAGCGGFAGALWTPVAEGPELQGVFENFLRVLVAYRLQEMGGALIHSSGVVDRGRAFLFLGPSGAGKSTLGRLALEGGREVLSDDMNAVIPHTNGFRVERLPFAGDLGQTAARSDRWPLAGLYRLEKGPAVRIDPLSPARSLAGLLACCPFVNADPYRRDALTGNLERLLEAVPAGRLTFSRDLPFDTISEAIAQATAGAEQGDA